MQTDSLFDLSAEIAEMQLTANTNLALECYALRVRLRLLSVETSGAHTSLLIHLTTGESHYMIWARISASVSEICQDQPTPTKIGLSIASGIASLSKRPYCHYYSDGLIRIVASFK